MDERGLACDLTAMDAAQRERHRQLGWRLRGATEETLELADGYTFRYPADDALCLMIAEFVTLERRCCPFFTFVLTVEPEGGPLWLRITGPEGAREFIREALGAG